MEVRLNTNKTSYIITNIYSESPRYVNEYLSFLAATGKSPNTQRSYAYNICLWLRYCEKQKINFLNIYSDKASRPVDTFSDFMRWLQYPDLHSGIIHLTKEKPARKNSTINQIMSTILNFYAYLSSNNVITELPLYKNQRINASYKSFLSELFHHSIIHQSSILKKPEPPPQVEYITRQQYKEMLKHCYLLRDKLILALLFEGGLRLGEVLGIHLTDLQQLEEGIIRITPRENNENGARVKRLAVGMIKVPDYVSSALLTYINTVLDQYETEYLFVSFSGPRKGKALKSDSVEKLFQRISKEMQIDIHPHMLRHGFATEKLANGWELIDIQAYLRHRSIRTTEIYAFYSNELKMKKMQNFFLQNQTVLEETADAIRKKTGNTD